MLYPFILLSLMCPSIFLSFSFRYGTVKACSLRPPSLCFLVSSFQRRRQPRQTTDHRQPPSRHILRRGVLSRLFLRRQIHPCQAASKLSSPHRPEGGVGEVGVVVWRRGTFSEAVAVRLLLLGGVATGRRRHHVQGTLRWRGDTEGRRGDTEERREMEGETKRGRDLRHGGGGEFTMTELRC